MTGNIFSIERYAVHDGGGIRTIVYFKGCPLRCLWCCNPESQETRSQLLFFDDRCIGCARCVGTCPRGASRRNDDGAIQHDIALCDGCGDCVESCPADARRLFGRSTSVDEVMAAILRDRAFYRRSGGGVTASGGEPAMQAEFVSELFRECRRKGVHTAMETCGYTSRQRMASIAQHLDHALYDLKHMDSEAHRQITGVPNEPILDNLHNLVEMGVAVTVRVPVIPGHNDSAENIGALADFVAGLPTVEGVDLLPYHSYGSGKYARCGLEYRLDGLEPPSRECMVGLASIVESRGVRCRVQ